jgi:phosphatidylglycerol:prolipoprotein diacylglycerol transferase
LALPYPQIDPVLIQIGPLAIRWYALAYIVGILAAWRYASALIDRTDLWAKRGPPVDKPGLEDLVLWITLGIIAGGRLGHVLFYTPGILLSDPMEVLRVWNGGMSFHGGCLGVLLAVGLFVRRKGLDLFSVGDQRNGITAPSWERNARGRRWRNQRAGRRRRMLPWEWVLLAGKKTVL